jgi:acyl-CoA hydrolase
MQTKKPSDSLNIQTEMIMPGHTNPLGNLMGGNLLCWMDVCASISAWKHCGIISVTAAVDNVSFKLPIKVGDIVIIKSFVTRSFNSSMEIYLEVSIQNYESTSPILSHTAFYTFVALDKEGNKSSVAQIVPESEKEIKLFDGALRRRELRLLLAGKIAAKDAPNIRSFFDKL